MFRSARHAIWFLILCDAYAYGGHVVSPEAFKLRAAKIRSYRCAELRMVVR